jgi:hypothetical protein
MQRYKKSGHAQEIKQCVYPSLCNCFNRYHLTEQVDL